MIMCLLVVTIIILAIFIIPIIINKLQTTNIKHKTQGWRFSFNPSSLKSLRIGGFIILKGSLKLKPNPSCLQILVQGLEDFSTSNHKPKTQGLRFGLKDKNF